MKPSAMVSQQRQVGSAMSEGTQYSLAICVYMELVLAGRTRQ